MNLIQFFNSGSSSNGSLRAVEPVVYQKYLTIATGTGSGLQDLMPALAVGDCAAYGGQIVNNGCYDLKLIAYYLEGDDCDACTPDTLTVASVEFFVPKNSVFPMPDGFYQMVQVQTVDSDRNAFSNTSEVKVSMHTSHVPNCSGCVQAVQRTPCGSSYPSDGSKFVHDSDGTLQTVASVTGLTSSAEIKLWNIDDAFNLKVNGTSISSFDQLVVCDAADLTTPYPNSTYIKFADNSLLNGGSPWDYDSNSVDPLVKITVSTSGVVSVKGLKSAGVYEDLVGATWATVPVNVGCNVVNNFEVIQSDLNPPSAISAIIETT